MKPIFLLTGAAGLLGSNICRQLIEKGYETRAFVLKGDKYAKYIHSEAKIFEGNLCDLNSLEPFFAVPNGRESVVIHCAIIVTVNPDYNPLLVKVNVGN